MFGSYGALRGDSLSDWNLTLNPDHFQGTRLGGQANTGEVLDRGVPTRMSSYVELKVLKKRYRN
jgi:hypothetical protein